MRTPIPTIGATRGIASGLPETPKSLLQLAKRFTLDGDAALEMQLKTICEWVCNGIMEKLHPAKLDAIVLGGGYGRGEGGVLRTESYDSPYNDMEFYVFLRGNALLNEYRNRVTLEKLEHEMTKMAGIEVEFKLHSLSRLQGSPVSMFSYDLVMGHRVVYGSEDLFAQCRHHRSAREIPYSELTRLLMNRCSGLLFAKKCLEAPAFSYDDADYIFRNLAKLRLALGDVVLGVSGQYHWSCRERSRRLERIPQETCGDWLNAVRREHRTGMRFKLHPHGSTASRNELWSDLHSMSELSGKVWLWLEQQRLHRRFKSFGEYASAKDDKCPETKAWRNLCINLRQFGLAAFDSRTAFRYPRERLLRTLPVLLWENRKAPDDRSHTVLREQLRGASRGKSTGWIDAYERIWRSYR